MSASHNTIQNKPTQQAQPLRKIGDAYFGKCLPFVSLQRDRDKKLYLEATKIAPHQLFEWPWGLVAGDKDTKGERGKTTLAIRVGGVGTVVWAADTLFFKIGIMQGIENIVRDLPLTVIWTAYFGPKMVGRAQLVRETYKAKEGKLADLDIEIERARLKRELIEEGTATIDLENSAVRQRVITIISDTLNETIQKELKDDKISLEDAIERAGFTIDTVLELAGRSFEQEIKDEVERPETKKSVVLSMIERQITASTDQDEKKELGRVYGAVNNGHIRPDDAAREIGIDLTDVREYVTARLQTELRNKRTLCIQLEESMNAGAYNPFTKEGWVNIYYTVKTAVTAFVIIDLPNIVEVAQNKFNDESNTNLLTKLWNVISTLFTTLEVPFVTAFIALGAIAKVVETIAKKIEGKN